MLPGSPDSPLVQLAEMNPYSVLSAHKVKPCSLRCFTQSVNKFGGAQ